LYHAAELYAASARALLGSEYPRDALEEGWRPILTNQFHDILPGSAISEVYRDAEADFQQLSGIGQRVLDSATDALAASLNLESDGLVVFNPSPYPSGEYIEVPPSAAIGVELPSQATFDGNRLVWCEGVPPNGYRAFPVGSAASAGVDNPLRISRNAI